MTETSESNVRQKDPQASLKFVMDYTAHLAEMGAGITVTGSSWNSPVGITVVDDNFTSSSTWIWLDDGSDAQDYEFLNDVAFSDGQTDQFRLLIQVRHKEAGPGQDSIDRANALTLLLRWIQPQVVPPLETTDIEAILDDHKAAVNWTPNTFYAVGQRILPPAPRTGVWYQVVQPGTSQAGARSFSEWPTRYGTTFGDGSSTPQLILETQDSDSIFRMVRSDPTSVNCYDVCAAARECIDQRLQLGSQMIDDDGQSFSQISENLRELRKRFYPIRFPVRIVRG